MPQSPDLRERDAELLQEIFRRFVWIDEVRLFGSRATGCARRVSDIDIAIAASNVTPRQWSELVEAIEEAPIIYHIDLVRIEPTVAASLLEKISREGIVIYAKAG